MIIIDKRKLIFKGGVVVFVLLAIGAYGYFKMLNLIEGPEITVSSPPNWSETKASETPVVGTALNISSLSLNDRPIFVDGKGGFSEKIALLPGYNIISIKAEDKFGKKTEKVLQVVLKE